MLADHAYQQDAQELRLWVLDGNDGAWRAYESLGFADGSFTQFSEKDSNGAKVMERLMVKRLR